MPGHVSDELRRECDALRRAANMLQTGQFSSLALVAVQPNGHVVKLMHAREPLPLAAGLNEMTAAVLSRAQMRKEAE